MSDDIKLKKEFDQFCSARECTGCEFDYCITGDECHTAYVNKYDVHHALETINKKLNLIMEHLNIEMGKN